MPRMPNQPIRRRCRGARRSRPAPTRDRRAGRITRNSSGTNQQRVPRRASAGESIAADEHDDRHLADPLELLVEAEHRLRHVGRRRARVRSRPRRLAGSPPRPRASRAPSGAGGRSAIRALDAPQREPGREHGQEAVAVHEQRQRRRRARSGRAPGSRRARPPPCGRARR